jgi:hypothetical protein
MQLFYFLSCFLVVFANKKPLCLFDGCVCVNEKVYCSDSKIVNKRIYEVQRTRDKNAFKNLNLYTKFEFYIDETDKLFLHDNVFHNMTLSSIKIEGNNKILTISANTFANIKNVSKLHLKNINDVKLNHLDKMTSDMGYFEHLEGKVDEIFFEEINILKNPVFIKIIYMLRNSIKSLTLLKCIEIIPDLRFMSKLTVLNMNLNNIYTTTVYQLSFLVSKKDFKKVIGTTTRLPSKLKRLILSENNIEIYDPALVDGLTNLEYLDLSSNELEDLPNYAFDMNVTSLSVNLKQNNFQKINNAAFCSKALKKPLVLHNLTLSTNEVQVSRLDGCFFVGMVHVDVTSYPLCDCSFVRFNSICQKTSDENGRTCARIFDDKEFIEKCKRKKSCEVVNENEATNNKVPTDDDINNYLEELNSIKWNYDNVTVVSIKTEDDTNLFSGDFKIEYSEKVNLKNASKIKQIVTAKPETLRTGDRTMKMLIEINGSIEVEYINITSSVDELNNTEITTLSMQNETITIITNTVPINTTVISTSTVTYEKDDEKKPKTKKRTTKTVTKTFKSVLKPEFDDDVDIETENEDEITETTAIGPTTKTSVNIGSCMSYSQVIDLVIFLWVLAILLMGEE